MLGRPLFALTPLLALALLVPSTASAADQTSKDGDISQVEVLTPSADAYLQYHGRVFLDISSTSEEFRWGGTSCGTRVLSTDDVAALVRAFTDGQKVSMRYQTGAGSAKCIVGFTLNGGR